MRSSSRVSLLLGILAWASLLPGGCQKSNPRLDAEGRDRYSGFRHDFSTPEGAIHCLEDAYRAKDVEAAVRCRDFQAEAQLEFARLDPPRNNLDRSLLEDAADVFERAYRKRLHGQGFPSLTGITFTFPRKETRPDKLVAVTTLVRHGDGRTDEEVNIVTETPKGWRVVSSPD